MSLPVTQVKQLIACLLSQFPLKIPLTFYTTRVSFTAPAFSPKDSLSRPLPPPHTKPLQHYNNITGDHTTTTITAVTCTLKHNNSKRRCHTTTVYIPKAPHHCKQLRQTTTRMPQIQHNRVTTKTVGKAYQCKRKTKISKLYLPSYRLVCEALSKHLTGEILHRAGKISYRTGKYHNIGANRIYHKLRCTFIVIVRNPWTVLWLLCID